MGDAAAKLSDWIGNRRSLHDVAGAAPVTGLNATFDRDDPPAAPGDPVPPGWQWLYFLAPARQSAVGPDGHPRRGDFMPPVELPRRMFAGGRMTFHRPIRVGEAIRMDQEIAEVEEKSGRSGSLVFVTVRHAVHGESGLCVEEEQDIVYREAAPFSPPPATPADLRADDWRRTIEPDPVLLFRFSALTFNGHRIHYDHPYVTEVEGYPGLIVHGPLTALLLLEVCRDHGAGRALTRFEFRARRPLFVPHPFTVGGRPDSDGGGCALQAVDHEGAVAMVGGARFATD